MTFELDHLFICVDIGATIADRLLDLGLVEGSSNVHPGQGTTNRRFFFHNVMLELLWVHDENEAQSAAIARTRLWERWHDRHRQSPFGICLRPSANSSRDSSHAILFDHWDYQPPYLPASLSIAVGMNSDCLTEPMLFQTPFGKRPDQFPPERSQPLDHPIGWRELTQVTIGFPSQAPPSAEFQAVLDQSIVQLRSSETHSLELSFDHGSQGETIDLRPELSLVMNW